MGYAFSCAVAPLATILLLPCTDMVFMKMFDEVIHVLQVTRRAAVPFADSDLFLAIVVVLRHARVVVWRRGNRAICIFRQLVLFLGRHGIDMGR